MLGYVDHSETSDQYYARITEEIQASPSIPYVPPPKEEAPTKYVPTPSVITSPAVIREWLNANGHPTGVRGRLSAHLIDLYYQNRVK